MSKQSMKKSKLKAKEKFAIALFMEAVPKIIEIWKNRAPEISFEEFCLREYDEAKNKSLKEV